MLKAEREFIKLKSRIAIVLKELSVSLAAGEKKKKRYLYERRQQIKV